jgi:predicted ester cyclase
MTAEGTRRVMEAYYEDLIGRGAYKRHFADDVVMTIEGTEQRVEGPDGVEGLIDYFHLEAFDARPELKNTLFADDGAVAELDFVGEHVGEFAGVAATGRAVRVPYCVVYELQAEKIKALRLYLPMNALMQQLGATS